MRILKDASAFLLGIISLGFLGALVWALPHPLTMPTGKLLQFIVLILVLLLFGVLVTLLSINFFYIRKKLKEVKIYLLINTLYRVKTRPIFRSPEGNMSDVIECPYCESNLPEPLLEITDKGDERTAPCPACSLKIWLEGDGWRMYRKVNNLEPGCMEHKHRNFGIDSGTNPEESEDEDEESDVYSPVASYEGGTDSYTITGPGSEITTNDSSQNLSPRTVEMEETFVRPDFTIEDVEIGTDLRPDSESSGDESDE